MIYTAIYQNHFGKLSRMRYVGAPSKRVAWLDAMQKGGSKDSVLIALVSGDHPVYFFSNFAEDESNAVRTPTQQVDMFDNVSYK
jgi:hypothetical protein